MAADVTLVILPPAAHGDEPAVPPELELLGLPMIRRNVLSATRAGIERVVVVTSTPASLRRPLDGTAALLRTPEAFTPPTGRAIVLAGHVLADSRWLQALCEMPAEAGSLLVDGDAAAILNRTELPAWPRMPEKLRDPDSFLAALGETGAAVIGPDPHGRFVLGASGDRRKAEDWLLQRLVKSGDSLLTRCVSRPMSLAISRRLAPTRVTPNQVTIASILIGLSSAPFFLSMNPLWQASGAALLLVHNIVDGCDGELARLKFQSSHRGMVLDMWGDNVVHAALFTCMGIGWSLGIGASWPVALAVIAVAGTLGTALLVYRQTMRWTAAGAAPQFSSVVQDRSSRLSRILNSLGNRDFIYGIFALALFGKAHWLLPLVAIGNPLFSLGLVVLARRERRSASTK